MTKYDFIISQAVELVVRKLIGINAEQNEYLTHILSKKGRKIVKELRSNGQKVNLDILVARLDEVLTQMNLKQKNKPIDPQQPIVDWYFIHPHATYYHDRNTPVHRSPTNSNIEFDYSTNSSTQKIVVNVINDDASSTISKNSKKSKHVEKKKSRIYTSPNTLIGSKTVEDIFQVVNNQRSTSSMTERVVIIDRHDVDTKQAINSKERLRIFDIHPSIPTTNNAASTIPSTGYNYNSYQQPTMYMSMPSNIYPTFYYPNTNSFYPFVYYHY